MAEVLAGTDVVIDVSNSPSFADDDVLHFFRTSTSTLLAAEQEAGVGHHVAVSIVGADRMPASGYMRAKVAQEELIRAGDVPWSVLRSTQFFEREVVADHAVGLLRAPWSTTRPWSPATGRGSAGSGSRTG